MEKQNSYNYDELIRCGNEGVYGENTPRLPLPPMLMFDRIPHISDEGGKYGKGEVVCELDITPDKWFFDCHFKGDPVMPGCLGVDALWQMLGFYLGWIGNKGYGRALGTGTVKFRGMIQKNTKMVKYIVDIKKIISKNVVLGIGDGRVIVDEKTIYEAKDLRCGLFDPSSLIQGDFSSI